MSDNIISQYYTKNDGTQISNDYQFSTLQDNEKIIHKNSGEKFVKNPSYSNVFDKANTFTDLNSEIKSSTVSKINNANSNGDVEYYAGTTKLGSFNVGIKQSDLTNGLNDVRSTSIANIDDATASGVCSCKNSSGTQIDTFTCHVPVNNSAPTLNWGQTSTIGTVDGTPLTVKMPGNPDTTYSAGAGLVLNGTTFSINETWLKNIIDNNSPDLEVQIAIFSAVPVFGTSSDKQVSIVGQKYAGSQLYKNVSRSGYNEDEVLIFSNPLSGTWTCLSNSYVSVSKTQSQTGPINYDLNYGVGTFCKV